MPLTDEEAKQVKEQLLKQLVNFPEDRREQIKNQINTMTTDELETFINQNNLNHMGSNCVFCSIVAGNTPSYRIGENDENIAILELNPLSKGHSLIVPKPHVDTIPDSTKELAEEISLKLRQRYSPKDIKINELKITEHPLLEVIPLYGNEIEREKASEGALKILQQEIINPVEIVEPVEEIPDIEDPQNLKPRVAEFS